MNAYKFAELPSNSSVASLVTLLVSGWFLVAAGAILSDPPSIYTQRAQAEAAARYAAAPALPQAHTTLTVVARRSDYLPAATTL